MWSKSLTWDLVTRIHEQSRRGPRDDEVGDAAEFVPGQAGWDAVACAGAWPARPAAARPKILPNFASERPLSVSITTGPDVSVAALRAEHGRLPSRAGERRCASTRPVMPRDRTRLSWHH